MKLNLKLSLPKHLSFGHVFGQASPVKVVRNWESILLVSTILFLCAAWAGWDLLSSVAASDHITSTSTKTRTIIDKTALSHALEEIARREQSFRSDVLKLELVPDPSYQ